MGAREFKSILFERSGHVAVATLNRPEVLNALDDTLRQDLLALAGLVRSEDDIRALVLTGAGRGFCSGADLSGGPPVASAPPQNELLDELEGAGRRAVALYQVDKPIIAAVNGIAAGAGMSLALSADMRVGDANTRFRTMFAERNLSPDSGMSYALTRILGYSRAADLVLTSRTVGAEEAYRLGLIDRLVDDDVVAGAVELAQTVAALPPLAVRSSKRVLQRNVDAVMSEALRYETVGLSFAKRAAEDAREAVASFREKRPGRFKGR